MTIQIAARVIAVLSLAVAMMAAVMTVRDGTETDSAPDLRHPGGEPAVSELHRCRDIGVQAIDDDACRKAWAHHRRRFIATGQPDAHTIPPPNAATSQNKGTSP
ncbi:putative entry exclusion protein TrbK-alt [Hyphomicrobium sp.]|uniref:putative entry exclusion protein TrbK-alt n=1 Tax=Hyphomicrobium sp. TaxID=82 RepID=UPI002FDFA06B